MWQNSTHRTRNLAVLSTVISTEKQLQGMGLSTAKMRVVESAARGALTKAEVPEGIQRAKRAQEPPKACDWAERSEAPDKKKNRITF